ncbi:MAG: YIP1 family protein [Acidobacteriota bacterium]
MLISRMLRVLKLDSQVFEEVEHDQTAMGQAITVVVIASLCSGIGALFGDGGLMAVIITIVASLVGWAVWSFLSFFIGTKLFGGKADMGEMLRVLGFAYTPACLSIIPIIGGLIGMIWMIVAAVIAIRQGLDISTGKAVGVAILALIGYIMIQAVFVMFGLGALIAAS